MQEIIEKLKSKQETISTMESCTGGALANMITNIPGASEVFMFGAVTYSNEFKIKMGVSKDVIDKYSVYSKNTAEEMSKKITDFTQSDYGVGVTGKLLRSDIANQTGLDNKVYICIYDRKLDKFYNEEFLVDKDSREANKQVVLDHVIKLLKKVIV